MLPTLDDTLLFVARCHRGQTDKAGRPYIFHPIRVMENLGPTATPTEQTVALLHDVVEDCDVTLAELQALGYPAEVVAAVDLLTKDEAGQRDYQRAIERVAPNPIARRVKIADLTDNLRADRIATPTEHDRARLEKYRAARAFLESWEAPADSARDAGFPG